MGVTFNDFISVNTYSKRHYKQVIGDPSDIEGDNPCYLTLGLNRCDHMKYFYTRFMVRKYFTAWCQLKRNTCLEQDDCSD